MIAILFILIFNLINLINLTHILILIFITPILSSDMEKEAKANVCHFFSFIGFITANYTFKASFGRFMRLHQIASKGCILHANCPSIDLEHIFLCHDHLTAPPPYIKAPNEGSQCECCHYDDWTERADYMVGFYQTSRDNALLLALLPNGDFEIIADPKQGGGVCFVRTLDPEKLEAFREGAADDDDQDKVEKVVEPKDPALIVALVHKGELRRAVTNTDKDKEKEKDKKKSMQKYDTLFVADPKKQIVSFIVCV